MAKFRKRPVVIEAVQWRQPGDHPAVVPIDMFNPDLKEYGIHTLEGFARVKAGDWIITGVRGEQYPCDPNVFALTYERIEDGTAD